MIIRAGREPEGEEGKEPSTSSHDDTEEDPDIVGHGQQHQEVGHPNFHRPQHGQCHTHQPQLHFPTRVETQNIVFDLLVL